MPIKAMPITRRTLLKTAAAAPLAMALAQGKKIPIGLELFSVRKSLQEDLMGTVRKVAALGYEDVEFFSPYYSWTPEQAKDVRKLMDDVGIKCLSTHNSFTNYKAENIQKAIDYNKILGTHFVVIASTPRSQT